MNNRVSGENVIGTIIGVVLFLLIAGLFIGDDDPECINGSCDNRRSGDSMYCALHKPASSSNSYKNSYSGSSYNGSSTSSTNKTTSSSTKKPTTSTTKKPSCTYYDPYDVQDYDNADDFADDWAEEFGDGDWDDGYDDAYDYWYDEMED